MVKVEEEKEVSGHRQNFGWRICFCFLVSDTGACHGYWLHHNLRPPWTTLLLLVYTGYMGTAKPFQGKELIKTIAKLKTDLSISFFFFFKDNFFKQIFIFNYLIIYLFIYFWLCWVFVSVRGLSPAAASGGHSSSQCAGLSLSRPLLLRSTGSRRAGSAVVAHGPSCSAACGIFPDQGWTRVPCISRQTLNHWATREARAFPFILPVFQTS